MIVGGMGDRAAAKHQENQAKRAAEIGRVNADQIDAAYRDELNTTIKNIRAIRAATGANPDSPSSLAFIEGEAAASDRVRRIKAGAARIGANQNEADARFYKSSARSALFGGVVKSLPYFLKAGQSVAAGF